jgi:hypothetical protein
VRYSDPQFGFSFTYPASYVILDESEAPAAIAPGMLYQLRVQPADVAASELGPYTPPVFMVQVFDAGGLGLEAWLKANEPDGTSTAAEVGGRQGAKLALPLMLAPNEFFYALAGGRVYRITPLGPEAEPMLSSLRLP